jgi:hypothetical protein
VSIGKQVSEAIDKMQVGDTEGALHALCSAIDATATQEYGKRGKESFKQFIHSNFGLISSVALGPQVLNLNLEYSHPDLPPSADGKHSIQDILYHAVRCELYHTTDLPTNIRFVDKKQIACDKGGIVLPASFLYGLIMAVVAAPSNSSVSSPKPNVFNIGDLALPISKLWGRRAELNWLLDAINEGNALNMANLAATSSATAVAG